MKMEEKKDENISLVTEVALELFLEKGIDNVKTKDIASKSGLTERSIYRYFPSRVDLILRTAFLLWERLKRDVEDLVSDSSYRELKGIEQIRLMLDYYSSLFTKSPEIVRFVLGAEMAFASSGVVVAMKDRPPGSFKSDTPLAKAIRTGLADGSVSHDIDAEQVYYLAYDSILGLMQRHVLGAVYEENVEDPKKRIKHLCTMLIAAFEGRI